MPSSNNVRKVTSENYPTDVGHTWHSTGHRYLKYLKSTGQQDTEEYKRALENIVQGRQYYKLLETDQEAAERYREDRMVENFQRSYQELEETHRTDIMGIYGNAHIVNTGYLNAEYYMAKQLKESYGEKLHTADLTQEPQRIDTLEVSGKTYTAFYYGEQDISAFTDYKSRKFWRLEDAYEDFKDLPKMHEFLPSDNYPVRIEAEQVFAVEYLLSDGSTEWRYYRSDGTMQDGQLITMRKKWSKPAFCPGKGFLAEFLQSGAIARGTQHPAAGAGSALGAAAAQCAGAAVSGAVDAVLQNAGNQGAPQRKRPHDPLPQTLLGGYGGDARRIVIIFPVLPVRFPRP